MGGEGNREEAHSVELEWLRSDIKDLRESAKVLQADTAKNSKDLAAHMLEELELKNQLDRKFDKMTIILYVVLGLLAFDAATGPVARVLGPALRTILGA